jgi:heat shock protein HtpX
VVNTFVIFLSRVIGNIVDRAVFRSEDGRGIAYFLTVMVTQLLLSVLATIIVMWFSRWREFRADRGGAQLAGRGKMIAALERLRRSVELVDTRQESLATLKIAGGPSRMASLFASHPPLEVRIARLQQYR